MNGTLECASRGMYVNYKLRYYK